MNQLSDEHRVILNKSAISDEVIDARGYQTITDKNDLVKLGFSVGQCVIPGLLLPVHTTDREAPVLYAYRPDNPRVFEDKTKKERDGTHPCKVLKYEIPKNAGVRLDCPPLCLPQLDDPNIPLWITEGQKKADALCSIGLCAIALLGVWNFKGRNEEGGVTFLADWDYIALNNRQVNIIFDSDVMVKPQVKLALERLTNHLQRKKATVRVVYLPHGTDGLKVGVDDWLAQGHTLTELENLVDVPKPVVKAAPPSVELLEEEPHVMRRPLALLGGEAFAATWLTVRETTTELMNKSGEIIKLVPPRVTTSKKMFVIRNDGVVFGPGGDHQLEEMDSEVRLDEIPEPGKTWSVRGLKNYREGKRPLPADVFQRLTDIVDQYIDFSRSFGSQRDMCEMAACYVISTWFLDAFNVVGNLWSNGDRGCGKTQFLIVMADLCYLGKVILQGGSYATLRDLADYGATLCFDDAESVSDTGKNSDPDKRALLLAGNRRGAVVSLKELTADKTWRTRYVNAFCPRLFSAIHIPDPVLASRTIIVPLIRTPDKNRANADPVDSGTWMHDKQQLIDDLWALGLENLSVLPFYDQELSVTAPLVGRALQPWRSLLATAHWLEETGVTGLRKRMDNLAIAYQQERPGLEMVDLTYLVISALIKCLKRDLSDVSDVSDINGAKSILKLSTKQITDAAIAIAKDEEMDIDLDYITSRRIGRTLGKMRVKKSREAGKGTRQWEFTGDQLAALAQSYGIIINDIKESLVPNNVPNVTNVTNVTDEYLDEMGFTQEIIELDDLVETEDV